MNNVSYTKVMRELANNMIMEANKLEAQMRAIPDDGIRRISGVGYQQNKSTFVADPQETRIHLQGQISRLRSQADIINAMLIAKVPTFLEQEYKAAEMKLSRESDPEWREYQRLQLKFGNAQS